MTRKRGSSRRQTRGRCCLLSHLCFAYIVYFCAFCGFKIQIKNIIFPGGVWCSCLLFCARGLTPLVIYFC
ncbi:UNVERIFIED_CONTAM: hypothetical protein PYX00_008914 [Menopon gallinae]|uniref:Uncharacterized protein n=1 Tax=Menopon gallinae TaxID=328185 RepID=A0AAW2H9A0_9NEOP